MRKTTMTTGELTTNPASALACLAAGQEVILTQGERPIANLVPIPTSAISAEIWKEYQACFAQIEFPFP